MTPCLIASCSSAAARNTTMQSWWMQMTDTATALELRDTPLPQPAAGQLLVRVHAAALNRGEFVLGHGLHGKAGTWKAIGGEGAGEVVAVGDGVTGFKPGDRVMGRCAGAFSEYALMEAAEAIAMPPSLSWEAGRQHPADVPRGLRHAGAAGPPQGRRVAADQRRVVGCRRGLAAAGQGARREGDRHVGIGRQAGAAGAARPGRRAVHARRRLCGRGDGGHRAAWRRPRRQHRRRLGVRREHSRAGLRGPARHRGVRRWRAARRHRPRGAARQTAHAVRRLQQAAQQGSSERPPCRASWPT